MIYKVYSKNEPNKIYIGSTISKLKDRLTCHKKNKRTTCREIISLGECQIEELEKCEQEKRYERERYYIETLECVNKVTPGKTKEEKRLEAIERATKNYIKKKDKILEDRRTNKIKCACGSVFRKDGKPEHERTNKHKNYLDTL
tara:strand:- start:69 stop:500 length:432 start_codon:yes stop_codon:yes gene_type:complete